MLDLIAGFQASLNAPPLTANCMKSTFEALTQAGTDAVFTRPTYVSPNVTVIPDDAPTPWHGSLPMTTGVTRTVPGDRAAVRHRRDEIGRFSGHR